MNILQLISGGAKVISYRPDYHPIIKEINALVRKDSKAPKSKITAVLLFQQICYWGERSKGQFYKFREPCNHNAYQKGDSWTEELGMTGREFDTARSMIAVKTNDIASDYKKYPIVYWTDAQGVTHYKVNTDLLIDIVSKTHLTKAQMAINKSANGDQQKRNSPNTEITTKNTTENTPATIDDLNPKRNAGIHPPLSTLESFILGSIEAELKTHSLANWVFKVVNGKQVNLDTFKAFCEGVNKDTFIADLQSILANWSNTGFARNNHAPTIGRILSVWSDDSAKASREFEALVVPLQEVIKRDKAEARRMVQTAAYEGIKATMQRNGINFDFVETARKEQWEKLK